MLTCDLNRKDIQKVTTCLRKLKSEDGVYKDIRRIRVYKIVDAIKALSKTEGFNKTEDVKAVINYLFEEGVIFKVVKIDKEDEKNKLYDISFSKGFTIHDKFIWEKEDHTWINYVLALVATIIVTVGILTVYFPRWYKWGIYYLKYPLIGFLTFLLAAAVVRWIVYGITFLLYDQQLWIWPNLFAECGFFESFVPLYQWVGEKDGCNEEREKEE